MQPDLQADAGELVTQIQDRARSLGLTWQIAKGTVILGDDESNMVVLYDGDTTAIGMTSMIGTLDTETRVWIIQVPPGGNYIVGRVNAGAPLYQARTILTASAASLTMSGIPTALRRLRISYRVRADNAVNAQLMFMRINANATANYFYEYGQANNVTAAAVAGSGATAGAIGICTGASAAAGVFGSGQIEIPGWDRAAANTNLNWTFVTQGLGTGVANFFAQYGGGLFNVAGPYTSIMFLPNAGNLITGTEIQIEGWPT